MFCITCPEILLLAVTVYHCNIKYMEINWSGIRHHPMHIETLMVVAVHHSTLSHTIKPITLHVYIITYQSIGMLHVRSPHPSFFYWAFTDLTLYRIFR